MSWTPGLFIGSQPLSLWFVGRCIVTGQGGKVVLGGALGVRGQTKLISGMVRPRQAVDMGRRPPFLS